MLRNSLLICGLHRNSIEAKSIGLDIREKKVILKNPSKWGDTILVSQNTKKTATNPKETRFLQFLPAPLLNDILLGRSIPIVGAGFSRNATPTNNEVMPLWKDLTQAVRADIPDCDFEGPVDALSTYVHRFGRAKLVEFLTKQLHVGACQLGKAHHSFCYLPFDVVCTTNLDFLLEQGYQARANASYCQSITRESLLTVTPGTDHVRLVKLHGDLHDPENIVATEEDFDGFIAGRPLMCTYFSNLLVTRTPLLIGYSFDDPDLRQLLRVVQNRLGSMRQTAYVLLVGASEMQISRFDRRGIKVISLPGKMSQYGEILSVLFDEIRAVWMAHQTRKSVPTSERSVASLQLPKSVNNRLCYFAIPNYLYSTYQTRIFPAVENAGFIPIVPENVISPGENILAKITALIESAHLFVAEISNKNVLIELALAQSTIADKKRILVVTEGVDTEEKRGSDYMLIRRPGPTESDDAKWNSFMTKFDSWLREGIDSDEDSFYSEASRLLARNEFRAAVIAAITLLETLLRRLHVMSANDRHGRLLNIRQLSRDPFLMEILTEEEIDQIAHWSIQRNMIAHSDASITSNEARAIVTGVYQLVNKIRKYLSPKKKQNAPRRKSAGGAA